MFCSGGRPAPGTAHSPPPTPSPAPPRRWELGAGSWELRGSCLWPAKSDRKTADLRGSGKVSHNRASSAHPPKAGSDTPQAPGGFPPSPREAEGAHTHRTHGHGPHNDRRVAPSRRPRLQSDRGAARHAPPRPPQGDGGVWGRREAPPDSPRARPPRPQGGRATPPGVFKPPRRDALGTWRGGGGRRATARPTGHRPNVDHQPPHPPHTRGRPRASALPARDAWGGPHRAPVRPRPEGPRRRRQTTKTPTHPPKTGQSPPLPPHLKHPHARPGGTDPRQLFPPPRHTPSTGGPLTRARVPRHPPLHHHHHRGQREGGGAPTGSVAPSGQGDTRQRWGGGGEGGRTGQTAAGGVVGGGGGRKPRGSERAGVGRRLATARQAPEQQTAGDRPRQTSPGPAAGGDGAKASGPATGKPANPFTPHSPRHATGGPTPCGPRPVGEGRQSWPAPRAKARGVGGGGRAERPLPPPPQTQPRGTWRGGPGGKRDTDHTHAHAHSPGGDDATGWRAGAPDPRGPGKNGGRGGAGRRGRAGRGGKAAEEESRLSQTRPPKLCTRRPNNPSRAAPHPPEPHTRAGHPPDPTTRGGAPSGRGGGRGSLPLSPFPSHPAPHGWRRGSRAGRGKATTPLSEPTTLMILPQVHLRKPCYDFYFL